MPRHHPKHNAVVQVLVIVVRGLIIVALLSFVLVAFSGCGDGVLAVVVVVVVMMLSMLLLMFLCEWSLSLCLLLWPLSELAAYRFVIELKQTLNQYELTLNCLI